MRVRGALAGAVLVGLTLGSCSGSTASDTSAAAGTTAESGASWADVVTEVRPSVLRIETTGCDGSVAVGSGFAVGPWVVTNRHVVDNYSSLRIKTSDDQTLVPSAVRVSVSDDLALLRVEAPLRSMAWESAMPRVGDEVAALGFPEAIGFSFAKGSISALNVTLAYPDAPIRNLIQTDTAVNFGNSGGPLINRSGDVVGVVVLTLTNTEGLAFAVDGRRAKSFVDGGSASGRPLPACAGAPARTVPPTTSAPAVPATSEAERVVRAFYAAIDAGDYATAWEMGGKNFEKNTTYARFASGFQGNERNELLVLDVAGDVVTVQVTARELVGGKRRESTYRGTYLVRDGQIRSGGLKLHTRRPL